MRKSKQNKGFTLLEILLVIAAIGILAAIVLVAINPNRQIAQARNLVRQADINTIQKALEQYLIDSGRYPNSVSTTPGYICNTGTEQTGGSTNCSGRVDLRELVPTYIAAIPRDPQVTGTNTGYNIVINPNNNKVGVAAELAESKLISINPYVINNGLVLHLDAGNPASYPGTGTTWFDLSGNGNNGTLVNGVGYNSSNGGSLVFDGVDDYATLSSSQIAPGTGAFTWNFWAKTTKTLSTEYSILFSGTGSNSNYGVIGLDNRTSNGLVYYANAVRIRDSNTSFGSNWWYMTFVGNGGADGARNLTLYRNTIQAGSTYTFDYNFNSTTPIIGANHSSFAELMRGNISNVSYYNRALTPSEIQQNFNALRGRFGL
jgi:prepilin-type N-terminal cleavage/methylation domain-containing protein